MLKKHLSFLILIALLIFTYIRFENYKPKILKKIQEVRGISTQEAVLPYPTGSIEVAKTENSQTTHITLKVPTDYLKIRDFYTNILLEKGWTIESEETNETFYTLNLKKKKDVIIIVSTLEKENGYTIVGLETTKTTR